MKLKNLDLEKKKKTKKNQNVMKLINSSCDETQIVIKPKNSICFETQKLKL